MNSTRTAGRCGTWINFHFGIVVVVVLVLVLVILRLASIVRIRGRERERVGGRGRSVLRSASRHRLLFGKLLGSTRTAGRCGTGSNFHASSASSSFSSSFSCSKLSESLQFARIRGRERVGGRGRSVLRCPSKLQMLCAGLFGSCGLARDERPPGRPRGIQAMGWRRGSTFKHQALLD